MSQRESEAKVKETPEVATPESIKQKQAVQQEEPATQDKPVVSTAPSMVDKPTVPLVSKDKPSVGETEPLLSKETPELDEDVNKDQGTVTTPTAKRADVPKTAGPTESQPSKVQEPEIDPKRARTDVPQSDNKGEVPEMKQPNTLTPEPAVKEKKD